MGKRYNVALSLEQSCIVLGLVGQQLSVKEKLWLYSLAILGLIHVAKEEYVKVANFYSSCVKGDFSIAEAMFTIASHGSYNNVPETEHLKQ